MCFSKKFNFSDRERKREKKYQEKISFVYSKKHIRLKQSFQNKQKAK